MSAPEVAAYVVGGGGLLTGLAAYIQAKSESKKNNIEGSSIGETALANAVKVVEEVYDKVTGRMNAQIDELLDDNKLLRTDITNLRSEVGTLTESERSCREEVKLVRIEIAELRAAQP